MEPWTWDPTLYAGAAPHYRAGRAPYPDALVREVLARTGADGRGRLLDLGCGPGSLTVPLAPSFREVVGVDADAAMLDEAALAADAAGVDVTWVHARAEGLPAGLGRFDVVTLAQSFHWFDRDRVAASVHALLAPAGALVHVQATTHRGRPDPSGSLPAPPYAQVDDLVRRYLGPGRRAGASTIAGTPDGEAEVLRRNGFRGPDRSELPQQPVQVRTVEQVVHATLSLSSSAPHLLGDRLDAFVADLTALLRAAAPDGRFAELPRPSAVDVWRPA